MMKVIPQAQTYRLRWNTDSSAGLYISKEFREFRKNSDFFWCHPFLLSWYRRKFVLESTQSNLISLLWSVKRAIKQPIATAEMLNGGFGNSRNKPSSFKKSKQREEDPTWEEHSESQSNKSRKPKSVQKHHNISWKDYKDQYGRCEVELAPFECKICGRVLKFDRNQVVP